jgi:hypothetical protein
MSSAEACENLRNPLNKPALLLSDIVIRILVTDTTTLKKGIALQTAQPSTDPPTMESLKKYKTI